jgi:FixJ family two-component response regulator
MVPSIFDMPDGDMSHGATHENRDRRLINVLIVDDLESERAALAALISGWGFQVETAENGQDALDKWGEFSADVIVLDLMMPTMDGFELMQLAATGHKLPVIVLTSYATVQLAVHAIHGLGAFWFLEKPIQSAMLRQVLELALHIAAKGGQHVADLLL